MLYNEFRALFGEVSEISLAKTIVVDKKYHKDTVFLLYIKPEKRIRNFEQMKKWLRARYKTNAVKVVTE